jgi:hypothetical protein
MLAWKLGASRIWLLGIDGYKWQLADKTEVYYYDGTPKPPERRKVVKREEVDERTKIVQDRHDFWRKQMTELQGYFNKNSNPYPGPFPGQGVYNLNPISTIDAWQRVERNLGLSWIEAFPGRRVES